MHDVTAQESKPLSTRARRVAAAEDFTFLLEVLKITEIHMLQKN
jgi:hypothetical protein